MRVDTLENPGPRVANTQAPAGLEIQRVLSVAGSHLDSSLGG